MHFIANSGKLKTRWWKAEEGPGKGAFEASFGAPHSGGRGVLRRASGKSTDEGVREEDAEPTKAACSVPGGCLWAEELQQWVQPHGPLPMSPLLRWALLRPALQLAVPPLWAPGRPSPSGLQHPCTLPGTWPSGFCSLLQQPCLPVSAALTDAISWVCLAGLVHGIQQN